MLIPGALINALQEAVIQPIIRFQAISGGDINQAFRLETAQQSFFLKYNTYPQGAEMLQTEASGLQRLAATNSIAIPNTLAQGSVGQYHYLLLEDWSGFRAGERFWENFGQSLASLHQHTAKAFGAVENNFIAKLDQSNASHPTWPAFYWEERIAPLARLSFDQQLMDKLTLVSVEQLGRRLSNIFPKTLPALLHGDLWNGNYMVAPSGQAGLIDPAVYFGHREMDLAMSRLFGGFQEPFYQAYQDIFPLDEDWEDRVLLCQLYPLLVHLLLFGRSYLGAVKRVIKSYQ